ncbi:MAG: hypothetical protein GEU28_12320 [Dehalococcoidia bacterium]|nr:hypothetical protein [Dehalococcoidia bacterium]
MKQLFEVSLDRCVDDGVCDRAFLKVSEPYETEVEVRTTDEIESVLARELGKSELAASDRKAILAIGGDYLIRECLEVHGHIDSPLLMTSDFLFRRPGMERQLLHGAGLLPDER